MFRPHESIENRQTNSEVQIRYDGERAAARPTQQGTFQKRPWVVRFRPEFATQMHGNKQNQSKHHQIYYNKHRTATSSNKNRKQN